MNSSVDSADSGESRGGGGSREGSRTRGQQSADVLVVAALQAKGAALIQSGMHSGSSDLMLVTPGRDVLANTAVLAAVQAAAAGNTCYKCGYAGHTRRACVLAPIL